MNSWDFSWIWPLTTILIYAMIISLIVSLFMKFLGLIPKREDARRDNDSINREVFKELSKAAKLNKVPRVKWVYVKPSKYQLPKRLGKYKGHIADPRMLILRIKTFHSVRARRRQGGVSRFDAAHNKEHRTVH